MAKYLLIYRGGDAGEQELSPQEMQKLLEKWNAWIGQGFAGGWMVDPGDALHPGGKVLHPNKTLTDGPFPESKELVGGFSVIKADTYEKAAEYAKGCPHLAYGGSIEIRQMAEIASAK